MLKKKTLVSANLVEQSESENLAFIGKLWAKWMHHARRIKDALSDQSMPEPTEMRWPGRSTCALSVSADDCSTR